MDSDLLTHPHSAENGELYMWGHNGFGQLGLGDRKNRDVPTQVEALHGRHVVALACGGLHSLAMLCLSPTHITIRLR